MKTSILQDTQRILDLIAKRDLDDDEKKQLIDETVDNFNNYINPGFLKYRKSFSPDYVAVEWADSGSTFTCVKGIEYIDCLGGYGIYNVGHRHPKVLQAVTDQLQRQALHSQELLDPLRGYLAKILAELTPGNLKYAFFTNSGTESVEGALKMAMLATERRTIIAAIGGFHGKSLGSLNATSKAVFRKPFLSSLHNMRHIPFNDLTALEQTLSCLQFTGDDAAAVLLEPILGEGGVIVPNDEYFPGVRRLCDKYGALLIVDEVQTGMGRTGKMFCVEHWNVEPDIICLGKAFGGGIMPAGAFIGSEKLWKPIFNNPFLHTTTFGGNPLACAAAIATINVLLEERLCERAKTMGDIFLSKLKSTIKPHTPHLTLDARGKGLLIALEFADTDIGFRVSKGLFREKILVAGTLINAKTIRIEPPLTITLEQINNVINALGKVLKEIASEMKPQLSDDLIIKAIPSNILQRTVLSRQLPINSMNPFEELITQTTENEMTRSQSFDLSNSGSSLFQQHIQISSVSNAIGYDPSRMATFLGHHTLNNNPAQKLETIYENLPMSKQNFSPQISSNFHWNQNKEEQLLDKNNTSVRGSVSSWNL